jgi:hypothetical protein
VAEAPVPAAFFAGTLFAVAFRDPPPATVRDAVGATSLFVALFLAVFVALLAGPVLA